MREAGETYEEGPERGEHESVFERERERGERMGASWSHREGVAVRVVIGVHQRRRGRSKQHIHTHTDPLTHSQTHRYTHTDAQTERDREIER
jgi:hypothetical protein